MALPKVKRRQLVLAIVLLSSALMSLSMAKLAMAEEPGQETEEYCLSCHADPELSITLPNGETLPLAISAEKLSQSVHTELGIECVACHAEIETYPHPPLEYASHRELSQAFYQMCWKCHSDNYDRTLDSMHADVAAAGNQNAPICTDCHSAHDIRPPDQPRAFVSETCGQCHTSIFADYKSSIHGTALIEEENPDVPVCTDCHGVHNIQDPRTTQFHIETPELCAGCHADQELMEKYGLSADVYSLYMLSWHGVDVSVYKAKWPTIWHESAICTDCHGVHDIYQTHDPRSSVNPKNLLSTCQRCHPDTGSNWTGAWTGHNPVSFERNPFVFYTDAFYKFFSPVVLWLSGIYVGLQILRATVARVRRSLR